MWAIPTDVAWSVTSVCMSVKHKDTSVSTAKMAEPIEMPFGSRLANERVCTFVLLGEYD